MTIKYKTPFTEQINDYCVNLKQLFKFGLF